MSPDWERERVIRGTAGEEASVIVVFYAILLVQGFKCLFVHRNNKSPVDEPWKVEDRGEKPAIALKGR
jgi:hypothetical protein